MAITTIDQLIAGMQATRFFQKVATPSAVAFRPQSLWGLAGIPGAGAFDTTLNGVALSNPVSGQLPFTDGGGGINTYMARLVGSPGVQAGSLLLCDRLWHNGGYTITSTSAQNSTTPTWPARDEDGSTNGKGIFLGLEISANAGAAAPTITVTYTNSAGTGSRTGAFAVPTANSPLAGSFFPIALQAGDVGVRSLQSIQLSTSWISGTMNMVAYRVICQLDTFANGLAGSLDAITGGMPRMFNGSVPFLQIINGGGAASVSGCLTMAQG